MKTGHCTVMGAMVRGLEALPVSVEVMVKEGLPGFCIVGMPDTHIQEARARVRAAVRSAGFTMPGNGRIVVNLAPNDLRKEGTGYDLPIAVGIMVATAQLPPQAVEGRLFAGELALDGRVLPVRGTVAYATAARNLGCAFVGSSRCADVIKIEGVEQLGLESLADMRSGGPKPLLPSPMNLPRSLDFKEVAGQEAAKRGLQIAAAGGHGVLIVGEPWSGKAMLASRMPSILPPLDDDERVQAASARSVACAPFDEVIEGTRPLRMPHFTVTLAGMLGGGRPLLPGEVALAHGGVLVFDDVAEFNPAVIRAVGHAVEQGAVEIARADGVTSFPAHAQVIALANPCPCGHFGGDGHCTCSATQIRAYQERVSGLVGSMVDMRIEVRRAEPSEFLSTDAQVSSTDLREGVMRARAFAARRLEREGLSADSSNAAASACLDGEAQALLEGYAQKAGMGGRDIAKVLKVARTIADMAESEKVLREHVAEALAFRL